MFDIHRPIIDESCIENSFDNIREYSIGVEFDEESLFFYGANEIDEIFLESRFTPSDTDAIEFSYSCFEKCEEFCFPIVEEKVL